MQPCPWVKTIGGRLYVGRRNFSASRNRESNFATREVVERSLLRTRREEFVVFVIMPLKTPTSRRNLFPRRLACRDSSEECHPRRSFRDEPRARELPARRLRESARRGRRLRERALRLRVSAPCRPSRRAFEPSAPSLQR